MEYPNADVFRSLAATVTDKQIIEQLVSAMQRACNLFAKDVYDKIYEASRVRSYKTQAHLDLHIGHFPMSKDDQYTIRNDLANIIAAFFRNRGFDVVVENSSLPWVRFDFTWYPTTIVDRDNAAFGDLAKRIMHILKINNLLL